MRYSWLIMFLALVSNSYASEEDTFQDLTWKTIIHSSVSCLDDGGVLAPEVKVESVVPKKVIPTLKLTAMEHDLLEKHKPAFLFFQTPENAYKLCDVDGGATLCLMYAICMQEMRQCMVNKTYNDARKVWARKSRQLVEDYLRLKFIIKHSIHRLMGAYEKSSEFQLAGLKEFLKSMDNDDITYKRMYQILSQWFIVNYDKLPPYKIEVTNLELGLTKTIEGIRYSDSPKHKNWSPIGNTLRYLCRMSHFENPLPFSNGVYELEIENLDSLIKAYNLERSIDQNLHADYHAIKTVTMGPNGEIIETITWVPIKDNPVIAYSKQISSSPNTAQKKKSL